MPKHDVRTVIDRFITLKHRAIAHADARAANNFVRRQAELELHDAALEYAAAVRRVARAGRDA